MLRHLGYDHHPADERDGKGVLKQSVVTASWRSGREGTRGAVAPVMWSLLTQAACHPFLPQETKKKHDKTRLLVETDAVLLFE